jgi:peptidoglycan/LPS O-acetylase OafA/YrhL
MSYLYLEKPPTACAMRSYAVARIARVIPLFMLVVIVCFATKQSGLRILNDISYNIGSVTSMLSHVFFLHGESVLWTIPPEIHFYVLFACAWLLRPYFRNGVSLLALLALVSYFIGVWPHEHTTTIFGLPATLSILIVLPYFIVGFLLGDIFHRWQPPAWLCSHWFVMMLFLIPLLYPKIFLGLTGHSHDMWRDPTILICMSLIFFSIVFLVPSNNPFLESQIGDKIGEISYSLYLLHYPLLLALKEMGLVSGFLGLLIFLLLSFALALLSFSLFEAPLRQKIRSRYLPNQR